MPKWLPFVKSDDQLSSKKLLERWQTRFKNCDHVRKQEVNNWKRWANMIDDNLWKAQSMRDYSTPTQVNELKAVIMSVLPYIILEPPVIEVRAYSMQDTEMAAIYEKVLEYIDRQHNMFTEFMYSVYNALLYGNGIMKLGYWEDALLDRPIWGEGITNSPFTSKAAFAQDSPLIEIYPPYESKRWQEMRYIFNEIPMHIDDLRDNPFYKTKAVRQLQPSYNAGDIYGFNNPEDTMKEYIKVIEIHDFRKREVRIMAEGVNDWIYEGPEPYWIVPFENLEFWPRPKSVWGDSISQSIEKHIKELSENATYGSRTVAKEALLKVLYNPAMIGPEEIQKLEDVNDSYVPILSDDDLSKAIHVVDYGTNASQYAFQMNEQQLLERIRAISGVTAQSRGRHEAGVETAVEANMLQTAADVRNTMRKRIFANFASRVLSKLLYIITLEYPAQRIAEMAGISPNYAWIIEQNKPFNASKFVVDYGMTAANSRQERLQKLLVFKQIVGENFLNPAVMAKLAAEVMDFDFTDEMMVYNALGISGGSAGTGNIQTQNAALGVANTRVDAGAPQPLEVLQGLGR